MATAILNDGSGVICAHGGDATPTAISQRVTVSGAPMVTVDANYAISGCPFTPPLGDGPCVTGRWITGATRVVSNGRPVAVAAGISICTPTGAPMVPVLTQGRVRAS